MSVKHGWRFWLALASEYIAKRPGWAMRQYAAERRAAERERNR